jgi:hypothetical protein
MGYPPGPLVGDNLQTAILDIRASVEAAKNLATQSK